MHLIEVKTDKDKSDFIKIGIDLYKNDPNWIQPLTKDIEDVFEPEKNKFIKRGGTYIRWLLIDENETIIGRIAAFINKAYKQEQPTGGIGFFECINNQAAANLMFDTCKKWLEEQGMEAMDGPINFGEREKWWGLLIEGYHAPLYGMTYNPHYYQELFENYGFKVFFNQLCYGRNVSDPLNEKFFHFHELLSKDINYKAIHISKNNLNKFAKDFCYVYNKAWAAHGEGKTMDEKSGIKMFNTMKPVIDEKLCWFAYYKDEPIAIWINLPDLNQYFKHMKGAFGIIQKLNFLWLKNFGKCDRFVGLVFGIIPEFQRKGIDAYLVVEAAKTIQKQKKYSEYEVQWIGDFNPKMINISESLGATLTRKLATYRYLFDRNKEYKRHIIFGQSK